MNEPKYRLFLFKNQVEPGSKRPYFTLKLITEEGEDWKEIGAFWKAKSGKGYSGFLVDNVELDTSNFVSYKEQQEKAEKSKEEYGFDD